jgi:hypothetical protein
MSMPYTNLTGVLLLLLCAGPLPARTIVLTAEDCDRMAVLSARAPRLSWAAYQVNPKAYTSEAQLHLFSDMALLMRFPLERIPAGQRITRAELIVNPHYIAGKPELHVRRLLTDWGAGVCHQYRFVHPEKAAWDLPGGRGSGTDRAARDTGVFRMEKVGEHTINVTEDVDLWYSGGARNRGWLLCFDIPGQVAYFPSPYSPATGSGKSWKLQVTFEPR